MRPCHAFKVSRVSEAKTHTIHVPCSQPADLKLYCSAWIMQQHFVSRQRRASFTRMRLHLPIVNCYLWWWSGAVVANYGSALSAKAFWELPPTHFCSPGAENIASSSLRYSAVSSKWRHCVAEGATIFFIFGFYQLSARNKMNSKSIFILIWHILHYNVILIAK